MINFPEFTEEENNEKNKRRKSAVASGCLVCEAAPRCFRAGASNRGLACSCFVSGESSAPWTREFAALRKQ